MSAKFNLIETKSNGETDFFIEGFVSTTDADLYDDIVTKKCQNSINSQLNTRGDITMDIDHSEWVDKETGKNHTIKKNEFPVAKVVESRVEEGGTFVKAKLNKAHPNFENIVDSIKEGFLHSFSIAYNVTKSFSQTLENKTFRVIDDLNIFNVAITGNPVNPHASFKVALKSFTKKMEDTKTIETLEAEIKSLNSDKQNLTNSLEASTKEVTELKSKVEAKQTEIKSVSKTQENTQAEFKSFNDKIGAMEEQMAEFKSVIEKIKTTAVNKAEMKSQVKELNKVAEIKSISFGALTGGNL